MEFAYQPDHELTHERRPKTKSRIQLTDKITRTPSSSMIAGSGHENISGFIHHDCTSQLGGCPGARGLEFGDAKGKRNPPKDQTHTLDPNPKP